MAHSVESGMPQPVKYVWKYISKIVSSSGTALLTFPLLFLLLRCISLPRYTVQTQAWDKNIGNVTWQFSNCVSVVRFTDNSCDDKPTEENPVPDTVSPPPHSDPQWQLQSELGSLLMSNKLTCSLIVLLRVETAESFLTKIFRKTPQNSLRLIQSSLFSKLMWWYCTCIFIQFLIEENHILSIFCCNDTPHLLGALCVLRHCD